MLLGFSSGQSGLDVFPRLHLARCPKHPASIACATDALGFRRLVGIAGIPVGEVGGLPPGAARFRAAVKSALLSGRSSLFVIVSQKIYRG